jgi:hypothetical protein
MYLATGGGTTTISTLSSPRTKEEVPETDHVGLRCWHVDMHHHPFFARSTTNTFTLTTATATALTVNNMPFNTTNTTFTCSSTSITPTEVPPPPLKAHPPPEQKADPSKTTAMYGRVQSHPHINGSHCRC